MRFPLLSLLYLVACSTSAASATTCSPACSAATTCVNGVCVAASDGAVAGAGRYENCSGTVPCAGGAPICLALSSPAGHTAAFCTNRCDATADAAVTCSADSLCVSLLGGDSTCLLRCTADSDCPFTNGACIASSDAGGQKVCGVPP